jgi:hypothetical protein
VIECDPSILYASETCFPGYNGLEDYKIRRQNCTYEISNEFMVDSFGRILTKERIQKGYVTREENVVLRCLAESKFPVHVNNILSALRKNNFYPVNYRSVPTIITTLKNRLKPINRIDKNIINIKRKSLYFWVTDCNN